MPAHAGDDHRDDLRGGRQPHILATAPARTQGLGTGEFAELLAAIRAGATYVNVHSTTWSTGEIRGQLDGPNRGN